LDRPAALVMERSRGPPRAAVNGATRRRLPARPLTAADRRRGSQAHFRFAGKGSLAAAALLSGHSCAKRTLLFFAVTESISHPGRHDKNRRRLAALSGLAPFRPPAGFLCPSRPLRAGPLPWHGQAAV